jgi:hypothetical protein
MLYCPRCGAQNADSAIYCSRCGSPLAKSYQQASNPTVVVVGNNPQQAPVGSNPGTVWLWLNIIATVLACCSNIPGIIGIIFGGIAVSKFNNGFYAEAKSNANVSKWLFIISLILGILGFVTALLFGGLSLIPLIFAAFQSGDFSHIVN